MRLLHLNLTVSKFQFRENSNADTIVSEYFNEVDRRNKVYLASPQYKERQRRQEKANQQDQIKIDNMIRTLPHLSSEADIVNWVGEFAKVNENTNVNYDSKFVVSCLKSLGYVNNDCVNHPEINSNRHIFARWIVGQAINCLESDVPRILPIASKFSKEYFNNIKIRTNENIN
jgi:hypothetical protein